MDDRRERMILHHELEKAGIYIVFQKMELLNHEHIHLAIQKFCDEIETDVLQEEVETYRHLDINQIYQLLLKHARNTPSFQHVHNILSCLLKIQDNPPEKRYNLSKKSVHMN